MHIPYTLHVSCRFNEGQITIKGFDEHLTNSWYLFPQDKLI